MNNTKKILIGVGAAIVIAGGIIAFSKLSKNRKEKKDCENAGGEWDRKNKICVSEDGGVVSIDNQTTQDIGKLLNVSATSGFTNVRTSPKIEAPLQSIPLPYPLNQMVGGVGNLIGKVEKNPLGRVTKAVKGDDGYTWYKVTLSKSINGKKSGYVREDAVSFT